MVVKLSFSPEIDWDLSSESHKSVVIIGTKKNLGSSELSSKLDKQVVQLVQHLSPEEDTRGDATTTYVPRKEGSTKVVVAAITDFASRNNCPARPDQVVELIKRITPKDGPVRIILVIDKDEYSFTYGLAVSRCFPLYSRKNLSKPKEETQVIVNFFSLAGGQGINYDRITKASASVRYCAKLVDTPTSELATNKFVSKAQKWADKLSSKNVTIRVIQGEDLVTANLKGIYGVGKAAIQPPALVVLSYKHAPEAKNVVWVGKGIVYDTGGLALKACDFMCGMKRDMGGAAAVFSAFIAAVEEGKLSTNLHALLCLAENAIGPNATRPDDILYMHSGKTVEVNNPDAEGRLVLSDGVSWAVENLSPDYMIDIATLTGAQGVVTGPNVAAILCNDEDFERTAVASGKSSGELVFPMLYAPEFHRPEYKSAVADMKNSVKSRRRINSPSSCAGQFIANHLGNYTKPWLHIDIAYPSFSSADERATGFGVGLLLDILKKLN